MVLLAVRSRGAKRYFNKIVGWQCLPPLIYCLSCKGLNMFCHCWNGWRGFSWTCTLMVIFIQVLHPTFNQVWSGLGPPSWWKSHLETILAAPKVAGNALQYASPRLCADREVFVWFNLHQLNHCFSDGLRFGSYKISGGFKINITSSWIFYFHLFSPQFVEMI